MTAQSFKHRIGDSDWTGRVAWAPAGSPVQPVILALHGGTYTSVYFDVPGHSLMDRAVASGFDIVAVDRPGYGGTTALPDAPDLIARNSQALNAALPRLMVALGLGGRPVFVIGHSIGGAIALTLVAEASGWTPIGVAVSGVGARTPPESAESYAQLPSIYFVELPTPMKDQVMFGPPGTYPAEMPAASHIANTHVPRNELLDITGDYQERQAEIASRIRVPVHYRQGEHEKLWINGPKIIAAYGSLFVNSPKVDCAMVADAGHCIDFHHAGPAFQRSQLDFVAAAFRS